MILIIGPGYGVFELGECALEKRCKDGREEEFSFGNVVRNWKSQANDNLIREFFAGLALRICISRREGVFGFLVNIE